MKNSKKGISLIVLVITIIVIIILAAAVLLTLNNNNPIENSKTATFQNDCAEVKSALALYVGNFIAKDANHKGPFPATGSVTISGTTTDDDPQPASTAGADTTTTSTTLSWTALGFNAAPASIASASYNPATGEFSFTANAGYSTTTGS